MRLKRWISLCLAMAFILLTACQPSSDSSSSTPSEPSSQSLAESTPESSEVDTPESESESSQEPESEPEPPESSEASQPESAPESSQTEAPSSESSAPQEPASETEGEGTAGASDTVAPPYTGEATSYYYAPVAAGTTVYGNSYVDIDVSNSAEGYCHVRYTGGGSARIKVLITRSGGNQYQYNLNLNGNYEVFPFSAGSGTYTIGVYQNVSGTSYSTLYSVDVSVSLRSSTLPFLYPNQQVNFWSGSTTVATGVELSRGAQSDLAKVERIYNYVINNIDYDFNKASTVQSGYIPPVDSILASGYGICFDYAAVMATMLRTQNIPTKVVVGYAGSIYHAWVSCYITDVGWVNGIIYFDGQSWVRMDPTFADSANQSSSIMSYIGNGSNYNPIYFY